MVESFNGKRVKFLKGKQRKFIKDCSESLGLKGSELANLLGMSIRTLSDWKREKFLLPLKQALLLEKASRVKFPKNLEIRDKFWYTHNGSSEGGIAVYKKYGRIGGDPEYRKQRWYEWWEREGKYKQHPLINAPKTIEKPNFSEELAEFTGIILGDGGITQRQVTITLHSKDDREYSKFVIKLIKKLFDVPIGIYRDKNYSAVNLVVSRSELVRFCIKKLGLKIGNKVKQQVDIPDWIKKNSKYAIACTRGLVDTDGSIFTHKYRVNYKLYSYKKLSFASMSKPLRTSVFNVLQKHGMSPRFAQNRDVRLDSKKDMETYFGLIGSHNPKHLNRYL
jgi:transcriptional regulator with XRE-family HTH domain